MSSRSRRRVVRFRPSDYNREELLALRGEIHRLSKGGLWEAIEDRIEGIHAANLAKVLAVETPMEQIRYRQGVIAGLAHVTLVLEEVDALIAKHLSNLDARV
jgi:hypothetical protein